MKTDLLNHAGVRFGAFTKAQERRLAKASGAEVQEARLVNDDYLKYLKQYADPSDKLPELEGEVDLSHLPKMTGRSVAQMVDTLKKKFLPEPDSFTFGLKFLQDKPDPELQQFELEQITDQLRQGQFQVPEEVFSMLELAHEKLNPNKQED